VTSISGHGVWLMRDDRERFLAFRRVPWFRSATVARSFDLSAPASQHLCWPDPDVDLSVDSIEHPARYPLEFGLT
jgi:hypothetical protein